MSGQETCSGDPEFSYNVPLSFWSVLMETSENRPSELISVHISLPSNNTYDHLTIEQFVQYMTFDVLILH